jgi:serine/threonine protein kinase
MSAVYKAYDPNLRRVVAVKLIHPHLSTDPDFIYRFKKEAAAVAAFRHPNIVQVYDFNVDGEVYYMVLEFIPGETLQDRLKHLEKSNTKMPMEQAVRIILNVCDALGYAHRQGVIHRDIKPANIMLDIHGQAILMDFGIVKILDDTSHTATGAVVGTARYMSPEVIRSEMPDERSDIYSLGVTFFEMLGGQAPFQADSAMSLLMRHLNDPVPDLSALRPDTPPELKRIINKTLEKDRDRRYRSAVEMADDLKRFMSTLETAPIPPIASSFQADADAHTASEQTFEQTASVTEPWMASMPADLASDEPTTVDETPQADVAVPVPEVTSRASAPPVQEVAQAEAEVAVSTTQTAMSPLVKFGGAVIIALALLVVGWFAFRNVLSPPPSPTATATVTQPQATATDFVVTDAPALTPTEEPTATVEPTATSTLPPLYVRINNITINDKNFYVVEYETFGYTEVLPGQHVHFFFNTVPVEQAGSPGTGPWKLYGGPRPFEGYSVSNRPPGATQMCALVANPNHSIIPESGNCFDLP